MDEELPFLKLSDRDPAEQEKTEAQKFIERWSRTPAPQTRPESFPDLPFGVQFASTVALCRAGKLLMERNGTQPTYEEVLTFIDDTPEFRELYYKGGLIETRPTKNTR
ncbi:MAG: hypothetical protein U0X91_07185 [Spirosomataceae bacterium]